MNTLIIFGASYLYLFAVAIFIISFFLLFKKQRKEFFIFALINLPIVFIASRIASLLYTNPRPFVSEHVTPLISHVADNGFPSDHTLLVATLASIIYYYNRILGLTLFALALLVGISRVYASVHHLVDILGSLVIAITVTTLVHTIIKRYQSSEVCR